jgi:hypothetical protein
MKGEPVREGTFEPPALETPARDLRVAACDDCGRDGTPKSAGGDDGDHSLGGSAQAAAS